MKHQNQIGGVSIRLIVFSALLLFVSCASRIPRSTSDSFNSFDASGFEVRELTLTDINLSFSSISDVYVSPSGLLYVLDNVRHYLYRYDPTSTSLDSLGGRGSGDYQFNYPVSIDATNDLKIFVADRGNRRIQLFDRRFQYLGSHQIQDIRNRTINYDPTILCVNRVGELLFWDNDNETLNKSTSNLTQNTQINTSISELSGSPADCALSDSTIFLLDSSTGLIHRYNEFGRYIGYLGGYGKIKSIAITDDTLWILTDEYLIQTGTNGSIDQVIKVASTDYLGVRSHNNRLFLFTDTKISFADIN